MLTYYLIAAVGSRNPAGALSTSAFAIAAGWLGIGCGALTVLFRYFGLFPEGVTYAILIMNACAWALDRAVPVKRFGVGKGGAGK